MTHLYRTCILLFLANCLLGQTLIQIGDFHQPTLRPLDAKYSKAENVNGQILFSAVATQQTDLSNYGTFAFDGEHASMWATDLDIPALAASDNGIYFLTHYNPQAAKYELKYYYGQPGEYTRLGIVQSNSPNRPPSLAVLNEQALFQHYTLDAGYELWRAGPNQPRQLLKDCNPGVGSIFPTELTRAGQYVYFRGGSSGAGRELWRTDGTEGGTLLLTAFAVSEGNMVTNTMLSYNGELFFMFRRNNGSLELWSSDGTPSGTSMKFAVPHTVPTPSSPTSFFTLGSNYVYLASIGNRTHPMALDLETGESRPLFGVSPLSSFTLFDPRIILHKTKLGNDVFGMFMKVPSGELELWKSGLQPGETKLVASFDPGQTPIQLASSSKGHFFVVFDDSGTGRSVWLTDGTVAGTKMVVGNLDIEYDYSGYASASADSLVFFVATKKENPFGVFSGVPFISDGTAPGTYVVQGRLSGSMAGSSPGGFARWSAGPEVFFSSWCMDGGGGCVVKTKFDSPAETEEIHTNVYSYQTGIVTTDEGGGKLLVGDLYSDKLRVRDAQGGWTEIPLAWPFSQMPVKGPHEKTYFFDQKNNLVASDGSPGGTQVILPGPSNAAFYGLTFIGDSLYFVERSTVPLGQQRIWSSDGTAAGSQPIEFVNSGSSIFLRNVGERLTFSTMDVTGPATTVNVRGFTPVVFSGHNIFWFPGIGVAGDKLVALGPAYLENGKIMRNLWSATDSEPQLLRKFASITGQYNLYELGYDSEPWDKYVERVFCLGNNCLFGAGENSNNVELWRTNGTTDGTSQILDINPTGSSSPDNFLRYDDKLWLFTANDGQEMAWWATNGTTEGTFKAASLAPLRDAYVPTVENPYLTGNHLYFSMNDGLTGQEPWVLIFDDSLKVGTVAPIAQTDALQVWPNPARDIVHLRLDAPVNAVAEISLLAMDGKIAHSVRQMLMEGQTFAVQAPAGADGLFILRVVLPDGRTWRRKVIFAH